MSANLLERIDRNLDNIAGELWNIDGPDDVLDKVARRLSLIKYQISIHQSLQATANLLRQHPNDKTLPRQRAAKARRFVHFVYGKEDRRGGRHKRLRGLDCDTLKFLGLSYTIEEILKMDDEAFEILRERGAQFSRHRKLSPFLYRPDVDKAADAKLEDPDDDGLYEKFIQGL
jgi:hypothetical protein